MAVETRPRGSEVAFGRATAVHEAEPGTAVNAWSGGRFDRGACAWSPAADLIDRPAEVVARVDLPRVERDGFQ
jgi:hypothetical protein